MGHAIQRDAWTQRDHRCLWRVWRWLWQLWLLVSCSRRLAGCRGGSTTTQTVSMSLTGMDHGTYGFRQFERSNEAIELSTRVSLVGSVSNWKCTAKLCLVLEWTSVFDADLFELDRYESKYPVVAHLFDLNVADQARLVVDAVDYSDPSVWIFSSNYMTTSGSVLVDLYLYLRQQSQRNSFRDQLVVHLNVTASTLSSRRATSSFFAYSPYGNQKVRYRLRRQTGANLFAALDIVRKPNQPDVGPEDVLTAIRFGSGGNTWVWDAVNAHCLPCTATLFGCSSEDVRAGECAYETTSSSFVTCFRESLPTSAMRNLLNQATSTPLDIDGNLACYDEIPYQSIGPGTEFWNTARSISCLANYRCPFGPLGLYSNSKSQVTRHIALTNDGSIVHTLRFQPQSSSVGYLRYHLPPVYDFGSSLLAIDFSTASETDITGMVNKTLNRDASDALVDPAWISATRYEADTYVEVLITIRSVALPGLSGGFQLVSGLWPLSDDVTMRLPNLEAKAAEFVVPANAWNWMWEYASSDCLVYTSNFLGCAGSAQVLNGVCTFESSSDPFVVCLRKTIDSTVFDLLAFQLTPVSTQPVRSAIQGCINDLQAATPPSNSWVAQVVNLGLLSKHQCMVGPLPTALTESTPVNVVTLSSGSMKRQSIFITGATFTMQLSISIGSGMVWTTSPFNEDSSESDIINAITAVFNPPDNSTIQVIKSFISEITAWQIEILYHDVLFPSFQVGVHALDETSVVTTALDEIDYPVLQSVPFDPGRLSASTRCGECDKAMAQCQLDPSCRTQALWCLTSELHHVVDRFQGSGTIQLLDLVQICFGKYPMATWRPLLRAMECYGSLQCPFTDLHGNPSAWVFDFQLPAQSFTVPLIGTDHQQLRTKFGMDWQDLVSGESRSFQFTQQIDLLGPFLHSFVLNPPSRVLVTSSLIADPAPPAVQVQLSYSSLPLNTPSFHDPQMTDYNTISPKMNVVVPSVDPTASIQVVGNMLEKYLSPSSAVALSSMHDHSPACVACYASFYKCSIAEVENESCTWYQAKQSPLAQCMVEKIPFTTYAALRRQPGTASTLVTDAIEACTKTVLTNTSTVYSLGDLSKTLSCFVKMPNCWFGPLEMAWNASHIVRLRTSPYVVQLRVPVASFSFQLRFFLDGRAPTTTPPDFVTSSLNTSMTSVQLRAAIAAVLPSEMSVTVVRFEYVDTFEWMLEVEFPDVVVPWFRVVAVSDQQTLSLIEQDVVEASISLVVTSRRDVVTQQCSICTSFLADCASNSNCRTVILPCLVMKLTALSASTGSRVDSSEALHSCLQNQLISSWLPVQRYLLCVINTPCPLDDSEIALELASYLHIDAPPLTQFTYAYTLTQAAAFPLAIQPIPGAMATLTSPQMIMGSISDFVSILETQFLDDAATVEITLVDVDVNGETLPQVTISFKQYLGLPIEIMGSNVANLVRSNLNISVITSSQSTDLSKLLETLQTYSSGGGQPIETLMDSPECVQCAQKALHECHLIEACQTQLLPCLINQFAPPTAAVARANIQVGPMEYLGTTVQAADFTGVLMTCASTLFQRWQKPVVSFFKCFESLCPVTPQALNGDSLTKLVRQNPIQTFQVNSLTDLECQLLLPPAIAKASGSSRSFMGTLEEFRTLLDALWQSSTDVQIQVLSEGGSSSSFQVEYNGYLGNLPFFQQTSTSMDFTTLSETPGKVLFVSRASPGLPQWQNVLTKLTTAATALPYFPQLCALCASKLATCYRREQCQPILQCFVPALNASSASNNLLVELQNCASGQPLASWVLLRQFLMCYEASQCPVSSSGVTPTFLVYQKGLEVGFFAAGLPNQFQIQQPDGSFTPFTGTIPQLAQALATSAEGDVTIDWSTDAASNFWVRVSYTTALAYYPVIHDDSYSFTDRRQAGMFLYAQDSSTSFDALPMLLAAQETDYPQIVPAHGCQFCAAALYGCLPNQVSSGAYAFFANDDPFASCLAKGISDEMQLELLTHALGYARSVGQLVMGCMANLNPSFYFTINDKLAWVAQAGCAFGTLTGIVSMTSDTMLTLTSQDQIFVFRIYSLAFAQAYFLLSGFINESTSLFSAQTSNFDMESLLKFRMPSAVDVHVTRSVDSDAGFVELSVTISNLFAQIMLQVNVDAMTSVEKLSTDSFDLLLKVVTNDGSKIQQITGLPPPNDQDKLSNIVPANGCEECAAVLYGCPTTLVTSGFCSFTSSTAPFMTCLVSSMDTSFFSDLVADSSSSIMETVLNCMGQVALGMNVQLLLQTLFKLSDQLACFAKKSCPFGPLDLITTLDPTSMVQLWLSDLSFSFNIDSLTFAQATFTVTIAGMDFQCDPFTSDSSMSEIKSVLAPYVPSSVQIEMDMSQQSQGGLPYTRLTVDLYDVGVPLDLQLDVTGASVARPLGTPFGISLATANLNPTLVQDRF